jgi:hypothetical protein
LSSNLSLGSISRGSRMIDCSYPKSVLHVTVLIDETSSSNSERQVKVTLTYLFYGWLVHEVRCCSRIYQCLGTETQRCTHCSIASTGISSVFLCMFSCILSLAAANILCRALNYSVPPARYASVSLHPPPPALPSPQPACRIAMTSPVTLEVSLTLCLLPLLLLLRY